jgi:predicted DNA binding CopG/RHH family protein
MQQEDLRSEPLSCQFASMTAPKQHGLFVRIPVALMERIRIHAATRRTSIQDVVHTLLEKTVPRVRVVRAARGELR